MPTAPWGTVWAEHLPSSHPAYLPDDVRKLLNNDPGFWSQLEYHETQKISRWVKWYRAQRDEYDRDVVAEAAAWDYYQSLPISHPGKGAARDNYDALRALRIGAEDELRAGVAKGVAMIRAIAVAVDRRAYEEDLFDALRGLADDIITPPSKEPPRPPGGARDLDRFKKEFERLLNSGIGPGQRPATVGGLFGKQADPFGSHFGSLFPQSSGGRWGSGPGIAGFIRSGPVAGSSGPQVVGYTPGVAKGVSGGDGEHGSQSEAHERQSFDWGHSKTTTQEMAEDDDGEPIGGVYDPGNWLYGSPKKPEEQHQAQASKEGRGGGATPDPTRDPAGFTGIAFLDDLTMRALRAQGAFIAAPLGASRGLYPDAETGGPGVTEALIAEHVVDPVAPVAGGEHYEPRVPRGRYAGAAPTIDNPYLEALYPDTGAGEGGGGSEGAIIQKFVGDRPRGPGDPEGGDPQAVGVGVTVVAVSAGVRTGTVDVRGR